MPTATKPVILLLGNPAPVMKTTTARLDEESGEAVLHTVYERARHINQSVTRLEMANGFDDEEFVERSLSTDNDLVLSMIAQVLDDKHRRYVVGVQHVVQGWATHSADGKPSYVECSDKGFREALAAFYKIAQGEPTALMTNLGRDDLHASHLSATQPAGYRWLSLSANTTTESTATVSLPGEITTASGGLIRGTATVAHTAGTNVTTLTRTFTANGSDSLPVVIAKVGAHNASSGTGNTGYEKLFGTTTTLNAVGDNVTVTFTDTIG